MKQPDDLWWQLESERLDQSWKQRPYQHQPTKIGLTRAEQRMFFDAGRYAAGARDNRAKAANRRAREFAGQNVA